MLFSLHRDKKGYVMWKKAFHRNISCEGPQANKSNFEMSPSLLIKTLIDPFLKKFKDKFNFNNLVFLTTFKKVL